MAKENAGAETLIEGFLVVEIGSRVAVGACGGLLAQLGAKVIVIEPASPASNGKWRNRPAMMAGKESLLIYPHEAGDVALLADLLARADIVIASTDDGGPGADAWDAARPARQILCDITAFGHDGPMAGRGGSEAIVEAYGGIVDTTGPSDGAPGVIGAPVLEMSAAVFAATSILAALRVRRLHGIGQRIDMAVIDTAVNALVNFLPLHFAGQPATRSGNRHPLHAPWGSYKARDGHLLLCSVTSEHFSRICKVIGKPQLASDERFSTSGGRLRNFRELDQPIGEWVQQRSVAECEKTMTALGIACGPIVAVEHLENEKNLQHRSSVHRLRDPVTGEQVLVPASPVRGTFASGVVPQAVAAPDSARTAMLKLVASAPKVSADEMVTGDARSSARPLEGLRVVEIGQYTVAPLVSRHLGSLGADVIKIESPGGDAIRHAAPLRPDGLAPIFALSNTDKRGLVLDLRNEVQQEMLHRLLAQSDVLVENLKSGALARLGFGGEAMRKRHPHLIYCSVNGFGNDSAYPGRPALDTVIQAMSGLMSLTMINGQPTKAGISASDMLGGEFGLLAVMAGLEFRDRTGLANHFDISMQDASCWMTQMEWPGTAPPEPAQLLEAADGYVLAVAKPGQLDSIIGAMPWQGDKAGLLAALQAAGIDAAPVLTVGEVVASGQIAARKLLIERPTTDQDSWTVLGSPLRLLSTPPEVRTAMARLGSEDREIITQFNLDTEHTSHPINQSGSVTAVPSRGKS